MRTVGWIWILYFYGLFFLDDPGNDEKKTNLFIGAMVLLEWNIHSGYAP